MIPIECPKCGRGGSVPPDRLNARLVCKACHTVFHLDNTGRMVMGDPESPGMKTTRSRPAEVSSLADFDLAQTLSEIPAPIKYGVPVALLAAIIWVSMGGIGGGSPDYIGSAESLIRSLTSNNRSKAISLSTSESAEAAGKWFDLLHAEIEKGQIPGDVPVSPTLFSGNAEKDSDITLLVLLSKTGGSGTPVTITMPMKREGSYWLLDANRGLELAEKAAATATPSSNNRR